MASGVAALQSSVVSSCVHGSTVRRWELPRKGIPSTSEMKLPSLPNTVAAPLAAFALSANLLLVPVGPATTPVALAADGEVRDFHTSTHKAYSRSLSFFLCAQWHHPSFHLSLLCVLVTHVCTCFLRSP